MKSDSSLLFLDCQTTGANPSTGKLLEIAWCRLSKEPQSYLFKQLVKIPWRIQNLTGVTDEELGSAMEETWIFDQLVNELANKQTVLAIHYASFEKTFLADLFDRHSSDILKETPILCTHQLSKRLFPGLPAKGIKGVGGFFGLPPQELKRAASHARATRFIWENIERELQKHEIKNVSEIEKWVEENPVPKKEKYQYRLDKSTRLGLPRGPGIYRMLGKSRNVLYVGKATSLHARVNSYFRGQKNRDSHKLEMLTQVWDIETVTCRSPLEAALLENDEIKKYNPPYNISLKENARKLLFYSRDFSEKSSEQTSDCFIGPFPSPFVFESLFKLLASLKAGEFDETLFYDLIPKENLREGFLEFCHSENVDPCNFTSFRTLLSTALRLKRREIPDDRILANDEDAHAGAELEADGPLTSAEIAGKFKRHFLRAGRSYLRSKKLTRLLNSKISWDDREIEIHHGELTTSSKHSPKPFPWKDSSVQVYDRMSILKSELSKLKMEGAKVTIESQLN